MSLAPLQPAAIDAVRAACAVARRVQHDLEAIRQHTKDDRSPVTVADFAVQAVISLALRESFGDDVRLVAEERADPLRDEAHRTLRDEVVAAVRTVRPGVATDAVLDAIDHGTDPGRGGGFWTLDPVDGTKGFLRGQQYAIALARIEDGDVVAGVMGCPNLPAGPDRPLTEPDPEGVLYGAAVGSGAWRIGSSGPLARLRAADTFPSGGVRTCESVEKSHSRHSDTARIIERIGGAGSPVRLDSQCKYAVVARGQADAYLRLPTRSDYVEKIWDHAAGSIIAVEAGAIVTDVSGSPLDFRHGRQLETNRGVICASQPVHARIIDAIEELGIGAAAR